VLDRLLLKGELDRAARRARLVMLALTVSLLVVIVPTGPTAADLAPTVYGLFVIQVVLALGALALELVKLAYARAERSALQKHALALITAHDERRRAIEERDELTRTVAGLRSLNEHLREELRARDDAVASAVHELRTPLTSVQAYGQLMTRNLQAVQRQVDQLERLISDLLALPGAKPFAVAEVDLVQEARDAAHRLRIVADADVEVRVHDEGSLIVRGDPGRLGQVLDNLLRNAAKFSPPGKPIELDIRREGAEVILAVTDRGPGIPADELLLVFERYYRGSGPARSVPGEGIGLAVSREIVAVHQGRIWATSPGPGKGSTFFIALPVAVAPEPDLSEVAAET
jgi:two-component system sensor histidine kinase MprB